MERRLNRALLRGRDRDEHLDSSRLGPSADERRGGLDEIAERALVPAVFEPIEQLADFRPLRVELLVLVLANRDAVEVSSGGCHLSGGDPAAIVPLRNA